MQGVNKITLIGNLTKDPEIKEKEGGSKVCSFSIACGNKWKDSEGQPKEHTEFVNCVAFSKTAEICQEYLKKGNRVYLEGKIQTKSYEKDGEKKYFTNVVISNLVFLENKKEEETII